jgi:hypothetical protein
MILSTEPAMPERIAESGGTFFRVTPGFRRPADCLNAKALLAFAWLCARIQSALRSFG